MLARYPLRLGTRQAHGGFQMAPKLMAARQLTDVARIWSYPQQLQWLD